MTIENVPAKDIKVGDRIQTISAGICTVTNIKDAKRLGYLAVFFDSAETSYVPPNFPVKRVVG